MSDKADGRAVSIDGSWCNDAGSELELKQDGLRIAGLYRTRLGAAEHEKDYPLVGWRDQRCLAFSVNWGPDSESMTSWTGLISIAQDGTPVISAMWLLVSGTSLKFDGKTTASRDNNAWEAFRTQSVIFRRTFTQEGILR